MWLFVLMAAVFLDFQNGVVTGYDGGTMYGVMKSMVDRGTFAAPAEWNALPGVMGSPIAGAGWAYRSSLRCRRP